MDMGNDFRRDSGKNNILARYAASEVLRRRQKSVIKRRAFIFKSLKHPDEAKLLRKLYGNGFYLIGLHNTEEKRRSQLIKVKSISSEDIDELIKRDREEEIDHGQKLRNTYHLSDVFIDGSDFERMFDASKRFIDILFGDPYRTPTPQEHNMFQAYATSLKSSDLSRQVGAVIVKNGDIIAQGFNDVPKAHGGLYTTDDETDERDFQKGYDSNKKQKDKIVDQTIDSVSSTLSEEQVKDLQEKLRKIIQSVNFALSEEQAKNLQEKLRKAIESVSSAFSKEEVKDLQEKLNETIDSVSSTLSEEQVKDLQEKLRKIIQSVNFALSEEQAKNLQEKLRKAIESVSSAFSAEQVKDLQEKLREIIQSVSSALFKKEVKNLKEKLSKTIESVSSALSKEQVKDLKEKLSKTIQFASPTLSEEQVKDLKEKLSKSIEDITEYGRAVHAEMEALLSATRTGVTVRGGTLYTTTFPCHNCTKHIVAAGIVKVVYIEPYPKSLAQELHGDAVSIDKEDKTLVSFLPFLGIGPRRYFDLFSLKLSSGRELKRKQDDGRTIDFEKNKKEITLRLSEKSGTYKSEGEGQCCGTF